MRLPCLFSLSDDYIPSNSFCLSGLSAVIGSLVWPEDYDWAETRALHAHTAGVIEESPDSSRLAEEDVKEKTDVIQTPIGGRSVAPSLKETSVDSEIEPAASAVEESPEHILKTFRFARWTAISAFVILMILYVCSRVALPISRAQSGLTLLRSFETGSRFLSPVAVTSRPRSASHFTLS